MDMDPVVIEAGSEAFEFLGEAMARPNVRKISMDVRSDGVAFKVNENSWTPTLSTTKGGRA